MEQARPIGGANFRRPPTPVLSKYSTYGILQVRTGRLGREGVIDRHLPPSHIIILNSCRLMAGSQDVPCTPTSTSVSLSQKQRGLTAAKRLPLSCGLHDRTSRQRRTAVGSPIARHCTHTSRAFSEPTASSKANNLRRRLLSTTAVPKS